MVVYFSDGAASQYLCYHKQDTKLNAEWQFSPLVMAEAHVMEMEADKHLVARAILQATTKSQILTAPDMFKWAPENIPRVKRVFFKCLLKMLYRIQPNLIRFHGLPRPRPSQTHVHIIASFLLEKNTSRR